MALENAIASELKDDATVAALVGTNVHIVRAHPGSTLPYIVIVMRPSTGHERHMTGLNTLTRSRGDILCYSATVSGVVALANAVRLTLDGFQKSSMGSGANTADVRLMTLTSPVDDLYAPTDGGAEGTHKRTIAFSVWLNEAIA